MERVQLAHTKIDNLEKFDWIEYFRYNNSHLLKLDFSDNRELTSEEKELITHSIRAFQIGEGSERKAFNQGCRKIFYKK